MASFKLFFVALFLAVSFSNMGMGLAARQLLQMPALPNLPTLPPLPSATVPSLPQPTTTLPQPAFPSGGLPPLPSAG
ncbi:unnamed protein product [Linum tenue]|uniref:Uncharacterized protein n=1 Tax=Linum tenue TaxID=586396 RepID=A0AAV0MR52_9ROSI|nr:unnamed protein product [Linum tenue]